MAAAGVESVAPNPDAKARRRFERLQSSVDNMDPDSDFVTALAESPTAPVVPLHSIIAVTGDGLLDALNDGVVAYQSAHIDGVESELVVRKFGHSVQGHPLAIEEVRRILYVHLAAP